MTHSVTSRLNRSGRSNQPSSPIVGYQCVVAGGAAHIHPGPGCPHCLEEPREPLPAEPHRLLAHLWLRLGPRHQPACGESARRLWCNIARSSFSASRFSWSLGKNCLAHKTNDDSYLYLSLKVLIIEDLVHLIYVRNGEVQFVG